MNLNSIEIKKIVYRHNMQEKSNLCHKVMQLGKKRYNIFCDYVSN